MLPDTADMSFSVEVLEQVIMKVRVIGLGSLVIAVIVAGLLISFAFNNFVVTAEAVVSMPEVAAVAAAVYVPVETLCKSNGAQMELCISSDDRGLFTVFDGVQTMRYVYAFYDAPGDCPPSMPGYQVRVSDWSLHELTFFGFDTAEFNTLNVGEYYCSFAPLAS
jgi:hypothetical protein